MLIPVILCGGDGKRLWPVSRQNLPKPFIKIYKDKTLFRATVDRVANIIDVNDIVIVTNQSYYHHVLSECKNLNKDIKLHYILEPCRRNTAPAISVSALYISRKWGKDHSMMVFPADHDIVESQEFYDAVTQAYHLSRRNYLVAIGAIPNTPSSEYGYIKLGRIISELQDTTTNYQAEKFTEKPTIKIAKKYSKSQKYLWNTGIFCFNIDNYLHSLHEVAPVIYDLSIKIFDQNAKIENVMCLDKEFFAKMPNISVDYAVMEKATKMAVVKSKFVWSDIGTWDAVSRLSQNAKSDDNNHISVESEDCYVHSHKRMIATVGLKNCIIVDTDDALLVAGRGQTHKIRQLADQLELSHPNHVCNAGTEYRPWGFYITLKKDLLFNIKLIVVYPKSSLSLQFHQKRNEHWIVLSGIAQVINGDQNVELSKNQSIYIPARNKHRLINQGTKNLLIIEVQTGNYFGEDDIVRLEDDYNREEFGN